MTFRVFLSRFVDVMVVRETRIMSSGGLQTAGGLLGPRFGPGPFVLVGRLYRGSKMGYSLMFPSDTRQSVDLIFYFLYVTELITVISVAMLSFLETRGEC